MIGKRLVLFELFGFKVQVDASWIFLVLLVTWSLASGLFPIWYEDLPPATYWWMGIAGAIGLFASLILHELSHSLVARRYGLQIKGITLFIFGGVAEMEEEPRSPKCEFLMAIAGPIASFSLALFFHLIAKIGAAQDLPVPILGVIEYLALVNVILGGFNLVPAFPLDGGRAFRAAMWYFKGDLRKATQSASRMGQGFGTLLMALGVLQVVLGNFIGGMWWFLIGLFLRTAAMASYQQLLTRRIFEGEPVRRFMSPDPVTVTPWLTIAAFVEDYVYHYHYDLFPVVEDHRLLGCAGIREVKMLPREEWARRRVADILAPCTAANTVDAETDAVKAMAIMRQSGNTRLMVVEDGRLVGMLVLKDMLEFFALKMDLEGPE
ncbi:MAG: M50 family metallopeptidase [Alphaproteobacteria bacterium]